MQNWLFLTCNMVFEAAVMHLKLKKSLPCSTFRKVFSKATVQSQKSALWDTKAVPSSRRLLARTSLSTLVPLYLCPLPNTTLITKHVWFQWKTSRVKWTKSNEFSNLQPVLHPQVISIDYTRGGSTQIYSGQKFQTWTRYLANHDMYWKKSSSKSNSEPFHGPRP